MECKKIVFIVPYYGKWPPYFGMWLQSVKANPTIDFLLITDLYISENIPDNVKVLSWTFEELKNYFKKFFDFEICLEKPYKLCDYKPAFGLLFQEYISDFDFWGNCDIDCVFGDIRKFIDPLLVQYDAIGTYGHMSLYRNCKKINSFFKNKGAIYDYKTVFTSNCNFAFDEITGVKRIFKHNKINCKYQLEFMADIHEAFHNLRLGHTYIKGIQNYKKQIFIWENGKIYQCYYCNCKLEYKEFLYIHFQKKSPVPAGNITQGCYIFYNKFLPRDNSDTDLNMLEYNKLYRFGFVKFIERVCWRWRKIFYLLKANRSQREIIYTKRKYQ